MFIASKGIFPWASTVTFPWTHYVYNINITGESSFVGFLVLQCLGLARDEFYDFYDSANVIV